MTQLILNIPNEDDISWLLPMLQRLGIDAAQKPNSPIEELKSQYQTIIDQGGIDRDNLEEFMKQFEVSRQDRPLPFRD